MKIAYKVHGIVQGVGYRNLVMRIAIRHGIRGSVRNVSDGSVEIVAVGDEKALEQFEQDIKVSDNYAAQVMHVEKTVQDPSAESEYKGFRIEKDRKL
jgi:acylphosphatase